MRRISICRQSGMYGINNEPSVLLLERDYRLLVAVARECDLYDKQRSSMADIRAAMDRLNARPKERK